MSITLESLALFKMPSEVAKQQSEEAFIRSLKNKINGFLQGEILIIFKFIMCAVS